MFGRKNTFVMIIVCLGALHSVRGAEPVAVKWRSSLEVAEREVAATGKPMLIQMTAEWCTYCHRMLQTTYTNEEVIKLVNENFIPVQVDADKHADLVSSLRIKAFPCTAIITADLQQVRKINGFQKAAKFERMLTSVAQTLQAETARAAASQQPNSAPEQAAPQIADQPSPGLVRTASATEPTAPPAANPFEQPAQIEQLPQQTTTEVPPHRQLPLDFEVTPQNPPQTARTNATAATAAGISQTNPFEPTPPASADNAGVDLSTESTAPADPFAAGPIDVTQADSASKDEPVDTRKELDVAAFQKPTAASASVNGGGPIATAPPLPLDVAELADPRPFGAKTPDSPAEQLDSNPFVQENQLPPISELPALDDSIPSGAVEAVEESIAVEAVEESYIFPAEDVTADDILKQGTPATRKPTNDQSAAAASTSNPRLDRSSEETQVKRAVSTEPPEFAFGGFCIVSAIDEQTIALGSARHTHTYQGHVLCFASTKQRDQFVANPGQYWPQDAGRCPVTGQAGHPRFGVVFADQIWFCAGPLEASQFIDDPLKYTRPQIAPR